MKCDFTRVRSRVLSHELRGKAGEPRLGVAVATSVAPAGCPTAFEQIGEVTFEPESRADIGEEPGEAGITLES